MFDLFVVIFMLVVFFTILPVFIAVGIVVFFMTDSIAAFKRGVLYSLVFYFAIVAVASYYIASRPAEYSKPYIEQSYDY